MRRRRGEKSGDRWRIANDTGSWMVPTVEITGTKARQKEPQLGESEIMGIPFFVDYHSSRGTFRNSSSKSDK